MTFRRALTESVLLLRWPAGVVALVAVDWLARHHHDDPRVTAVRLLVGACALFVAVVTVLCHREETR